MKSRSQIKILGSQSTIILLAVVVLIFSLLSPGFFSTQNFVNILVQASALTIVATGMTFVLLTAGIDLSVGSVMFITGVVSGKLVVAGMSIWLAGPLIVVIGILFGLLNGVFIIKLKIVPFIVTLATFFAGRGLGLLISETRAVNLPETFLQIGSAKVLGIPFPVLVMILVVAVGQFILNKVLLIVYLICGLCAAVGGLVAIAQLGAISPSFGFQSEFTVIAAAVLGGTSLFGGKGKIFPGTLVGALLIQSIQSGLVFVNADPYLYPLITGTIIFLIVLADSQQNYRRKRALKAAG